MGEKSPFGVITRASVKPLNTQFKRHRLQETAKIPTLIGKKKRVKASGGFAPILES